MIVDDVMTRDVISVPPNTLLKEVARLLTEHGISGVPVEEHGKVVGVVSEADIVSKERGRRKWWLRRNSRLHARTAGDAMTSPAITIQGRRSISSAAALMSDHDVNRLPVVDDRALVGIVTRADLVRAFARPDEDIRQDVVKTLRNLWVSPQTVRVEVRSGEVTLRGAVTLPKIVKRVPAAIERVPGVVSVKSELVEAS
jgi:CBS domain-containing protein